MLVLLLLVVVVSSEKSIAGGNDVLVDLVVSESAARQHGTTYMNSPETAFCTHGGVGEWEEGRTDSQILELCVLVESACMCVCVCAAQGVVSSTYVFHENGAVAACPVAVVESGQRGGIGDRA